MPLNANHISRLVLTTFLSFCVVSSGDKRVSTSSVLVVLLARNEEPSLPLFFHLFEKINYPKDKISLFIRSDHNIDRTNEVIDSWVSKHGHEYNWVNVKLDSDSKLYSDENGEADFWSYERRDKIIRLREKGLMEARKKMADFVWFLDVNAFIRYPDVLQELISKNKSVVAPLLTSNMDKTNFWGGMTEKHWYKRSDDYIEIVQQNKMGCFPVALVSHCVLVNLNHEDSKWVSFRKPDSAKLSSYNAVPLMAYITFAVNAITNKIPLHICNERSYGNIYEVDENDATTPKNKIRQISHLGLDHVLKMNLKEQETKEGNSRHSVLKNYGFDKIYCINLARRPERRKVMGNKFKKLDMEPTWFRAFDGKELNASFLKSLRTRQLNTYQVKDMTLSGTGNFLSHYSIWKEVVDNNYKQVMIFEDAVKFHEDFQMEFAAMMQEIDDLGLEWDLIYLGRRPMSKYKEHRVYGSKHLLKPQYSWWTIGYLLSYEGAKKLVDADPLKKMVPTDEFVPIMYGSHPRTDWSDHFGPHNLKAFAINPVITEPIFYKGDKKYMSDTSVGPQLKDIVGVNGGLQWKENVHSIKMEF